MRGMSLIGLATDFGDSVYVGEMKAVILARAPAARVVDLFHSVSPQCVLEGAFLLSKSWPFFPEGSILVAVVDPGVGSDRRILAVRAHRRTFLAPDNGLLSFISKSDVEDMRVVENRSFFLPHVSATFHGRDIFAPVAGALAKGTPPIPVGGPDLLGRARGPACDSEGQFRHVGDRGEKRQRRPFPQAPHRLARPAGVVMTEGLRTIKPGEYLFLQGQEGHELYFLKSGALDVVLAPAHSEVTAEAVTQHGQVIETFDRPGQLVGEISPILNCPRTASIRARAESTVLAADMRPGAFENALRAKPALGIKIAEELARRVNKTNDRLKKQDKRLLRVLE